MSVGPSHNGNLALFTDIEEAGDDSPAATPWHAVLSSTMLARRISSTQHDAILRNLGAPDDSEGTTEAWRTAAEQMVQEAGERTVEELRVACRAIRDQLDPDGAARRFDERYERRSFRMWIDADGVERGSFAFEHDGAAWLRAIIDAAMRPRRGGPRFMDSEEKRQAADLVADSRTNDQLSYDLLIDVLRAGALAEAQSVFGTRQAGVRVVQVVDSATGSPVSARSCITGAGGSPARGSANSCSIRPAVRRRSRSGRGLP